jgi:DDE_Tnp_1-associated
VRAEMVPPSCARHQAKGLSVSQQREVRRKAGFLKVRLPELKLSEVADPRNKRGRRWRLEQILRSVVVGIMAGCKSLAEVEKLTTEMSQSISRMLGLGRRIADTTMRDALCKFDMHSLGSLRMALHRVIKGAQRRKAIEPVGLPFGVLAMDGKATALCAWDDEIAQRHANEETHHAYGLMRTVTCTLTSAAAKPCIDAIAIESKTNEMGFFQTAFSQVTDNFSSLFTLVTYDAGVSSEDNGRAVVEAGKHYLFGLKNENRLMFQLAEQLLTTKPVVAKTVDVMSKNDSNKKTTTRSLRIVPQSPSRSGKSDLCWSHTRTLLSVTATFEEDGKVVAEETRYFNSSLESDALEPEQWLRVVRDHWAVENNNHNTFDKIFREDDKPFITYDTRGAYAVLLLRRIAYTMLALFRSVSQRSEDKRQTPWRDLLRSIYNALIAATDAHLDGLREPKNKDVIAFS